MRALLLSLILILSFVSQALPEGGSSNPDRPEIDENNQPKCSGPDDYFFIDDDWKMFDQCGAIFLQKLQAALRKDDTRAIYKMLAPHVKWYRCTNRDNCDGASNSKIEQFIIPQEEQEFMKNYHLIFHKEIKDALLQASVNNITMVWRDRYPEDFIIKICGNLILLNTDFSIAIINDLWPHDGCVAREKKDRLLPKDIKDNVLMPSPIEDSPEDRLEGAGVTDNEMVSVEYYVDLYRNNPPNPYWPEVDEKNPPNCDNPAEYFYNNPNRLRNFDQCCAIFLKKLQAALRKDDKEAIYKMLAVQKYTPYTMSQGISTQARWMRCKSKNWNDCNNDCKFGDTIELYDQITFETEQEFIKNYHLIFRKEIKDALLQASVYDTTARNELRGDLNITIYGNLLWLDSDFRISMINDIWIHDGCTIMEKGRRIWWEQPIWWDDDSHTSNRDHPIYWDDRKIRDDNNQAH